jgi:hypothetical protein
MDRGAAAKDRRDELMRQLSLQQIVLERPEYGVLQNVAPDGQVACESSFPPLLLSTETFVPATALRYRRSPRRLVSFTFQFA